MFLSWIHAVIFGVTVTLIVGVVTSVVIRANVKKMNKSAKA